MAILYVIVRIDGDNTCDVFGIVSDIVSSQLKK